VKAGGSPGLRTPQSEDLIKTMQIAGAIGKPDIYFLEEIEHPPDPY